MDSPVPPHHSEEARGPRVDRRALTVGRLDGPDPDADFWLSKSPAERLAAVEICREAFYGRDAVRGRVARVLEIVFRDEG